MRSKVLYLAEIGNVVFRKNKRNKKINITVKYPGAVSVTLPVSTDFEEAFGFVENNKNWVIENLGRIKTIKRPQDIIDEKTNYKTRRHAVCFCAHDSEKASCVVQDGKITVNYPGQLSVHDDYVQKIVKKGIDQALQKEAEAYLPGRAEFLSSKTGLQYSDLALFNSKKYWGMCMDDNLIKLNIHLMRLPDDLTDYVILHELTHIREKNHSPKFYEILKYHAPEHKILYQKMKNFYPSRYN